VSITPEDDTSSAFEQGISREGKRGKKKWALRSRIAEPLNSSGVVSHRFHDLLFDHEFQ
jgi:hypothetical protein